MNPNLVTTLSSVDICVIQLLTRANPMFICVSDDLRIEQCYDIAQLIIAEPF